MLETFYLKKNIFYVLDQRLLPGRVKYIRAKTYLEVRDTIRDMAVRGAPAIGVAAAYGYAFGVGKKIDEKKVFNVLLAARPTAVNLYWALERMRGYYLAGHKNLSSLLSYAEKIKKEDISINENIGKNGLSLFTIPLPCVGEVRRGGGFNILTHCNAGALATAGYGTALGVIRALHKKKLLNTVYADETRPYLQGARLTAFELVSDGIKTILICDNMAGYVMLKGLVDAVIVGADRIASNGDTANKIGTYSLSILAKYHKIPFFIVAPLSTIDCKIKTGKEIVIEERKKEELTLFNGKKIAPDKAGVFNPAFDVTPHSNITAIITEKGNIFPPFNKNIREIFSPIIPLLAKRGGSAKRRRGIKGLLIPRSL